LTIKIGKAVFFDLIVSDFCPAGKNLKQ